MSSEWPLVALDEVATVTAGNPAPQGAEFFESGDRPFVRVQDLGRLNGATHVNQTADLVNDRAARSLKLFPKGSVLFTKSGASLLLNQRAILGRDMHVVSHVGVAVPGHRVTSEWLYYWLRQIDFANLAHGANMPSLQLSRVKQIQVPLPPIEEQHARVAEIEKQFSRLDRAGDNLHHLSGKLKRYRASVLKFFYSGGTMSDQLPLGWHWTTIGKQFRVEVGATPSRRESTYWGGAIPWVSSGEVQFGRIKHTAETITDEGFANCSTKLNPSGSVLLGMIGQGRTRGQAAILEIEAANNQNCAAIWVSKTETPPEFVYYWLMSQYEATRQVGSGNNQQAMNKSLVQCLPIPWPRSIAEQRRLVERIEERLSVVEEMESQVHTNLARIERLRQSVLHRSYGPSFGTSEHEERAKEL